MLLRAVTELFFFCTTEKETGRPQHAGIGWKRSTSVTELPPQCWALRRPAAHQSRGRTRGRRSGRRVICHHGRDASALPQPRPRDWSLAHNSAAPRYVEPHPRSWTLFSRAPQRASKEKICQGGVAWEKAHPLPADLTCRFTTQQDTYSQHMTDLKITSWSSFEVIGSKLHICSISDTYFKYIILPVAGWGIIVGAASEVDTINSRGEGISQINI